MCRRHNREGRSRKSAPTRPSRAEIGARLIARKKCRLKNIARKARTAKLEEFIRQQQYYEEKGWLTAKTQLA